MNPNFYIGKTIGDLARCTGLNHYGYSVFVLRNDADDTGRRAGEDYTLRNLVQRFPHLRNYVVKIAYDYYGQYILRVYKPEK